MTYRTDSYGIQYILYTIFQLNSSLPATASEICWQNQLLVFWFGVKALGDETRGSCSTLAKNSSKPIGGGVLEGWKMYRELLLEQSRHCHVVVAVTRNFDYQRIFPGWCCFGGWRILLALHLQFAFLSLDVNLMDHNTTEPFVGCVTSLHEVVLRFFSSAYRALSTLTEFANYRHSQELQTSVLCKFVPRLKRGEDGVQAHLTGEIDGTGRTEIFFDMKHYPPTPA